MNMVILKRNQGLSLEHPKWMNTFYIILFGFSILTTSQYQTAWAATTVYSNSFESGGEMIAPGVSASWNNNTTSTTPGIFSHPPDNFRGEFSNGTVILSLTNLPPHSSFSLEFQYFMIRSVDGNFNEDDRGADVFTVSYDSGNVLLYTTFRNPKRGINFPQYGQSYPDTYNPANPIENDPRTGAIENDTLGFFNSVKNIYQDSVYNINLSAPHTGNLTLHFNANGLQNISNESWGIDDIEVNIEESTDPTSIPPTKTPFMVPTSTPTEVSPTPIRIPTRTPTPTRSPTSPPLPEVSSLMFQISPVWMQSTEEGMNSETLLELIQSLRSSNP